MENKERIQEQVPIIQAAHLNDRELLGKLEPLHFK